jgi:hypothetical protein
VNKLRIIRNLEMLCRYISHDIEKVDKSIEYWKNCIEELGADTISVGNETYGEALDASIEDREYLVNKLEENNKLIEELAD